jgi:hypothetical protein
LPARNRTTCLASYDRELYRRAGGKSSVGAREFVVHARALLHSSETWSSETSPCAPKNIPVGGEQVFGRRENSLFLLARIFVFVRNVVLGNFAGPHFAFIGVRRIFDPAHNFGLKRLAFLFQFFNTFRIYDLIP